MAFFRRRKANSIDNMDAVDGSGFSTPSTGVCSVATTPSIVPTPIGGTPAASLVEAGEANPALPDTRLLAELSGCVDAGSTVVEVTEPEGLRPASLLGTGFTRRESSASAMSAASIATSSTSLATPTFPSECVWTRRDKVAEDIEAPVQEETERPHADAEALASCWTSYTHEGFSHNDEYDMSQLLAALGEDFSSVAKPPLAPLSGFDTPDSQTEAATKGRHIVEDEDDFYVPTFRADVQRQRQRTWVPPSVRAKQAYNEQAQ